jgi:hypothetical protein
MQRAIAHSLEGWDAGHVQQHWAAEPIDLSTEADEDGKVAEGDDEDAHAVVPAKRQKIVKVSGL